MEEFPGVTVKCYEDIPERDVDGTSSCLWIIQNGEEILMLDFAGSADPKLVEAAAEALR